MDDKQELRELLERLDESNRQQAKYARWQCIFSILAAVCIVGLFALVHTLMPQVQALTAQTEVVLTNLTEVTDQLAGMDLGAMVDNVDELVVTSQNGVEQAMEKLNSIDFAALNQAIEDLSDVIEPLAKFFNIFH